MNSITHKTFGHNCLQGAVTLNTDNLSEITNKKPVFYCPSHATDNPELTYDDKRKILDRIVNYVNHTTHRIKQKAEKYEHNSSKGSENKKIAELEKEISSAEKAINAWWQENVGYVGYVSCEKAFKLIDRLEKVKIEYINSLISKKKEVAELRSQMCLELHDVAGSAEATLYDVETINAKTEFRIDANHVKYNIEVTKKSAENKLISDRQVQENDDTSSQLADPKKEISLNELYFDSFRMKTVSVKDTLPTPSWMVSECFKHEDVKKVIDKLKEEIKTYDDSLKYENEIKSALCKEMNMELINTAEAFKNDFMTESQNLRRVIKENDAAIIDTVTL